MELSSVALGFLVFAIIAVCVFEFINGFHDTANAVATVIYTKSLKPKVAVMLSGCFNFLGIMAFAKISVAIGLMKLLPLNDMMNLPIGETTALILALLLTAILWNLGTWYFGIPCSSSHTLIGSMLGVGLAFYTIHGGDGINWQKAKEIGIALLISPLFGFTFAIILMFIFRQIIGKKNDIFKTPGKKDKPPFWIRILLICTCSTVSFFHGSNDGQKGIGLLMIVLLTYMPVQYSLNNNFKADKCLASVEQLDTILKESNYTGVDKQIVELKEKLNLLIANPNTKDRFVVRKDLQKINKILSETIKENHNDIKNIAAVKTTIKKFEGYTDFAPSWAKLLIALCLGLGTMIGYKRIVVTIGEKIGKNHMTYAEGATAELIASITIGVSSFVKGLPVSTTHILSSGIAGSMTASNGVKNLQAGTIKSIVMAWVLTLPVTIGVSYGLYMLFRLFI